MARALAVLLTLAGAVGLASGTPTGVVSGPFVVTLHPPNVEGLAAIRLEMAIDGRPAGVLQARKREVTAEPSMRFTLQPGFHRYTLGGHVELESGRRDAIAGAGVIVAREYLEEQLASPAAQREPLAALEQLLAAHKAVAGTAQRLPRLERPPRRPGSAEIAAAEERLGVRFPAAYRRLLELYGPFTYLAAGDDGEEPRAALYAPDAVRNVAEWRRLVRKAPLDEGDTPRARKRLAALAADVVIGTTFDTGWTVRAGTHPRCPDGSPSLSGEFIFETRPGEDLWNDDTDHHATYFGDVEPQCGDRLPRLRDNFSAAFVDGLADHAAVPDQGALRPQHDEGASAPRVVTLSFGEAR